jgi:hypothetical protein
MLLRIITPDRSLVTPVPRMTSTHRALNRKDRTLRRGPRKKKVVRCEAVLAFEMAEPSCDAEATNYRSQLRHLAIGQKQNDSN